MNDVMVHEEDLLAFAARAQAARRFPELEVSDPAAERILSKLEIDPSRYDDRRLRASLVRTRVVDALVREFFERNPDGLAVGLFPGLCTRFSRVDDGHMRWLDLEAPPLATFVSEALPTDDRHVVAPCCSLQCNGVLQRLAEGAGVPMLLLGLGVLRRASAEARDLFLTKIARLLPSGTELVLDFDARSPIRPASLAPNASLTALNDEGDWVRYPRLRFVAAEESSPRVAHELAGVNAVARLFRGNTPALAHVRLV